MNINLDPNAPPPSMTEFADWLRTLSDEDFYFVCAVHRDLDRVLGAEDWRRSEP